MSSSRKRKSALSDDFVVDDDDETTTHASSSNRASKKSKPSNNGDNSTSQHFSPATSLHRANTQPQKDEEGNPYWEISKARRVTVSAYRGKQMVSIREYYEKEGKWLPGKKGISLTVEQYSALLGVVPGVHGVLRERGEEPERVEYGGGGGEVNNEEREEADDGTDDGDRDGRPNYADTDED